jgi:hypothetical protein
MNLTALLALESTVIESIRSRCDFGKQHPGFALRATRPLDVGKMRRSYGSILGHRTSLHAAGAVTELSVTGNIQPCAVMSENDSSGAGRDGQY